MKTYWVELINRDRFTVEVSEDQTILDASVYHYSHEQFD